MNIDGKERKYKQKSGTGGYKEMRQREDTYGDVGTPYEVYTPDKSADNRTKRNGRRVTGPNEGKLPPIKLGKSDGHKAKLAFEQEMDTQYGDASYGYEDGDEDRVADSANKKQANRMRKKAKAGKQKAKKALNMSDVSDKRLDEILGATGEQQDRSRRKAGLLR